MISLQAGQPGLVLGVDSFVVGGHISPKPFVISWDGCSFRLSRGDGRSWGLLRFRFPHLHQKGAGIVLNGPVNDVTPDIGKKGDAEPEQEKLKHERDNEGPPEAQTILTCVHISHLGSFCGCPG